MNQINKQLDQDNFLSTVNTMIPIGNMMLDNLKKGRDSNPINATHAKDLFSLSKDLYRQYSDLKKNAVNGGVSKNDFTKKLNVCKALVDEGYFVDPTNVQINEIINDWNFFNKPAPVEEVVVKATVSNPIIKRQSYDKIMKAAEASDKAFTAALAPILQLADEIRAKQKLKNAKAKK